MTETRKTPKKPAPGAKGRQKTAARARAAMVKKKKVFLVALAKGASIGQAASEAGAGRCTVYRWKDEDPEFAEAWEEAEETGTDLLEDVAYDRAVKKSDLLLMFLLKARRPKYRDKSTTVLETPESFDVNVTFKD